MSETFNEITDTSAPEKEKIYSEDAHQVKLDDCPFCGSAMRIGRLHHTGEYGLIHVDKIDCIWVLTDNEHSDNVFDTPEEVAEKWNRASS